MLSTTVTRKYGPGPTWSKQLYFFSWRRIWVYEKIQTTRPCISPTHINKAMNQVIAKSKNYRQIVIYTSYIRVYIYIRLYIRIYICAITGTCIWCLNFPSGSDPKWISYASMLGGGVLWYTVVFFATSKQVCRSRADSRMRVECAKPGRDGRKRKWHPESGTSPWKGPGAFVGLSDHSPKSESAVYSHHFSTLSDSSKQNILESSAHISSF